MNSKMKETLTLAGFAVLFLVLAAAFRMNLWGKPVPLAAVPPVNAAFTNTATVRMSAAERVRTGKDVDSFDCYVCHEKKNPPKLKFTKENHIVLPDEHKDLVMQHGRNNRNDNCYNCHDPENLDRLKTRDGRVLKFEEGSLLCANCHGPTYRDWEVGIHGRTSGYWSRRQGEIKRQNCTDCHDPHAPAFASLSPAPGPHPLHPKTENHAAGKEH